MDALAYPLPRETRESAILDGDGGDTYGPFAFKIFDEEDIEVWRLDTGETVWALQAVTVTKTAAAAYDTFSILFPAVVPATTTFIVSSRRLHERAVAATRGGAISAQELEKELSKQGSVLQELRRDLNRTVRFPPGFDGSPNLPAMTPGKAIIVNPDGDGLTTGPDADEIAAAEGHADAANQSAIDAAADRAVVQILYNLFVAATPNANPLTYAQMEALAVTTTQAYLKQDGYQGWFQQVLMADHAALAAADTGQNELRPYTADATKGWLRIRKQGDPYLSSEFGHDLAVAMAVCVARGGGTVLANKIGTIAPAAGMEIPVGVNLIGMGPHKTVLDFAAVAEIDLVDGKWAVSMEGAGLTAITSNFVAISKGDKIIQFNVAHGLAPGDVICIYNSANGSFLPSVGGFGGRNEYRQGQRLRVASVNGFDVLVDEYITFAYPGSSTTTIYKQDSCTGRIGQMTVSLEGSAVAGTGTVRIRFGDRVQIDNLRTRGGAYEGLALEQCFECDGSGTFHTDFETASGNSYPLVLNNCSRCNFHDFEAGGDWNGVSLGGVDEVGGIQNHKNVFSDFVAFGHVAGGTDLHGNCDITWFIRGTISNGISMGGRNTVYIDCHVDEGVTNTVLLFSEVYGGRQAFLGGSLTARSTNSSGAVAKIHGWGGAAFRAAKEETFFELKTYIEANAATFLMGIDNDSASYPVSHDIDIHWGPIGAATGAALLMKNTGGVGAASLGRYRDTGAPIGLPYAGFTSYTCEVYDYPKTKISDIITTAAAATVISGVTTSFRGYPLLPKLALATAAVSAGGETPIPYAYAFTETTLRIAITNNGGANFTAGQTKTITAIIDM